MTDEEVQQLVLQWLTSRGGEAIDEEVGSMIAILEERCPSPDVCTIEEAKAALGLT